MEVNQQDTFIFWTWKGTAYVYNIYRDGDILTTVEQPAFADSITMGNLQYCYNFARELHPSPPKPPRTPVRKLCLSPSLQTRHLKPATSNPDGSPYEITDITRRIVLHGSYNAAEGIPVSGIDKGMYLLRMKGLVGRFVKE